MGGLVGACGGSGGGGGGGESSGASSTPKNTIVYAITSTPPDIDPNSSAQFVESELFTNTMSRLFDFKTSERDDGTFVMESEGYDPVDGSLAESWEVSDDRKEISIKLREGVKNQLGNTFSAKDVRYTVDRLLDLKGTGTVYLNAIGISKRSNLEVIDDYNIKFKLDYPAVLFFKMLSIPHLGIMDSTEMKKHTKDDDPWSTAWAKTNNVGFGPYYITQNRQGVQVALKADPNFWKGKAAVDTVIMKEVPSSANRLALLKGGAVDVVAYLQPRERISLKNDKNIKVASFEPAQTHSVLYMTNTKKPFDDPRVRQAVCYALPYDEIVETVGQGTARRQHGPLPANYEYYADDKDPYNQDIDKAKQLLADAGYADGFDTSIGFSNDDPTIEQQAASVQNALETIGIRAKLLKQPFATYNQSWLGAKYEMGIAVRGRVHPGLRLRPQPLVLRPEGEELPQLHRVPQPGRQRDARQVAFDVRRRRARAARDRHPGADHGGRAHVLPGRARVHLPARKNIQGINYWTYSAQHFDQWQKK